MITIPYETLNLAIENSLKGYKPSEMSKKHIYGKNNRFLKGRLLKSSNIIELTSSERFLLMLIINSSTESEYSYKDKEFFGILESRLIEKVPKHDDSSNIVQYIPYSGEIFPTVHMVLADYTRLIPFEFKIDLASYF